ncbi:MAG: GMC family oxidoreductase [Micropepsaceae bacterium]
MTIQGCDFAALQRGADVVVAGAGPVGLKCALDLADAGLEVLLIESGTAGRDDGAQALSAAEIRNAGSHAPMDLAVQRGFGGTSALWGGRAVPFDAVDFEARAVAPGADWPIGPEDVAPWYAEACRFLDCGPADFSLPLPGLPAMNGLTATHLERWCARNDMGAVHGARVAAHPKIRVALGATVTRIEAEAASGAVSGLTVAMGGQTARVTGHAYVIAAGGVETARLMLASRSEAAPELGGPALGRFYMGHAFGSIADIQFLRPGDDKAFTFFKDASGRYVRRRFTLEPHVQRELGLTNMAAWPDLPELYDPAHRSAILSLAYLALKTPVIGPRLMSEAIRLRKIGPSGRTGAHLWNVIKGAPGATWFAARFLAARYSKVRLPGFFVLNGAHRYALHFHAEHVPDADSRVTLSDSRDALGMRRAVIDLRFGAADAAGVVRTHDAMDERMQAAGYAKLIHAHAPDARAAAVLAQASDGFHQIGTARMGADPATSVVDADARVHGMRNLFVAGSAVLPRSGQANPTLLAVALAGRLAKHLGEHLAEFIPQGA